MIDRGRDFEYKGDFLEHVSPNQEVFLGDPDEDPREYGSAVTSIEDVVKKTDFEPEMAVDMRLEDEKVTVGPQNEDVGVPVFLYAHQVLRTNQFEREGYEVGKRGIEEMTYRGDSGTITLTDQDGDLAEITYDLEIPEQNKQASYSTTLENSDKDSLRELVKFDRAAKDHADKETNLLESTTDL